MDANNTLKVDHIPEMDVIISKTPRLVLRYSAGAILFGVLMLYICIFRITLHKVLSVPYTALEGKKELHYVLYTDSSGYAIIKSLHEAKLVTNSTTEEMSYSLLSAIIKYQAGDKRFDTLNDALIRNKPFSPINLVYEITLSATHHKPPGGPLFPIKGNAIFTYSDSKIFTRLFSGAIDKRKRN
jgi:hypothetical protein